jgi:hypothetical protein
MRETKAGQEPHREPPKHPAKPIEIANHLAQRRTMAKLLERQKRLLVSRRTFGPDGMRARVLIGGKLYDVSERQLRMLENGTPPDDLLLEEIEEED